MGDASRALANLCNYTGIVVEPKVDFMLFKEVEFVKLSRTTILAVFVTSSGMVHTRLVNYRGRLFSGAVARHEGLHERKVRGLAFLFSEETAYLKIWRKTERPFNPSWTKSWTSSSRS